MMADERRVRKGEGTKPEMVGKGCSGWYEKGVKSMSNKPRSLPQIRTREITRMGREMIKKPASDGKGKG